MDSLETLLPEIVAEVRARPDQGRVADYIPQLAKVPAGKFGIAVAPLSGPVVTSGDADEAFSIQSISKLFTLTLALGQIGDRVWDRVGREPSGNAFNSIVQLEYEQGRPRNPFVNAGAIAVTDIILGGHRPKEAIGDISASCASSPTTTRSTSTRASRIRSRRTATATWRSRISCARLA